MRTKHALFNSFLPAVIASLKADGYDISSLESLGEGAESAAFYICDARGEERVLKLCAPLVGGWQPDWGRREFDALLFPVEGEEVHETPCGSFWFVQEYAKTFDRADEIPDDLWEEFEEITSRIAENLFLDDTGLAKQVGLVERDDGQHLVVFDYGAFSTQDFNQPSY